MNTKTNFRWAATTFLIGAFGLLAGCGSEPRAARAPVQIYNFQGEEFGILEPGNLKVSDKTVQGSGTILFRAPRTEVDNNFAITTSLSSGSRVVLVSNADNRLQGGVKVTLAWIDGKGLQVLCEVAGQTYDFATDHARTLAQVPKSESLRFEIDVHAHGDLVVEVAGKKMGTTFSAVSGGKLWGLILNDATVTEAKPSRVKFPH